jgi:hypothetical protein
MALGIVVFGGLVALYLRALVDEPKKKEKKPEMICRSMSTKTKTVYNSAPAPDDNTTTIDGELYEPPPMISCKSPAQSPHVHVGSRPNWKGKL